MTVQELFEYIDMVKPNAFDDADKLRWLNQFDGEIQTEMFLIKEPELYENLDEELHLKSPWDMLYEYYMTAMVDFWNGEYDKYSTTMEMYNAKYDSFCVAMTTHYPTIGPLVWGYMTTGGEKT